MTEPGPRRIELVDALRGFALFGILLVNIPYFATVYLPELGLEDPQANTLLDDTVTWLTQVLFETKFYLLFAFLFGYSFVLQQQAAERAEAGFVGRSLRRMFGLFVLGMVHAVFLWFGDILMVYAGVGLALILFRNARSHTLVVIAVVVLSLNLLLWLFTAWGVSLLEAEEFVDDESLSSASSELVAWRSDFWGVLEQRISVLPSSQALIWFVQWPVAFAMALFGIVAARAELLTDLARHRDWFKRVLVWGLPIGLVGGVIFAESLGLGDDNPFLYVMVGVAGVLSPVLTSAYVSGIVLSVGTKVGRAFIDLLAPLGKMALSNYVLQSVLMGLIFYGYGLGLIGKVTPVETFAIAVGIFAVEAVVSGFWVRRFAYGPLEWVLRAYSYLKWPAMRRAGPA